MLGISALAQFALAEFPPHFVPAQPSTGRPTGGGNLEERVGYIRRRRKREQELEELRAAARRVEEEAAKAEQKNTARALAAAAELARQAAFELEQAEVEAAAEAAHVARLTRALNAAANATSTVSIMREANRAHEYALRMIEEMDEDEAATLVLLS